MNRNNLIQTCEETLGYLKGINFKSGDVSDLVSTPFFLTLNRLNNSKPGKYIYHLAVLVASQLKSWNLLNIQSQRRYPQAHALIIRALINLFKVSNDREYLDLAKHLSEELITMRSTGYTNFCWGQPFNWPSHGKVMKAFTPRATVSSQAAMAFLDLHDVTQDQQYLNIAQSVCHFYLENLHQHTDDEGDICFSYTSKDQYIIHNASMLAAAVLYRTWSKTNISEFLSFGRKAANFTAKHQNPDGSWHYSGYKTDKIDNYHTGFVLESYLDIKEYTPTQYDFEPVELKGMDFYANKLFTKDSIPKLTPEKLYPIDIQSCAQSILTFIKSENKDHKKLANKVLNYTLSEFFNSENGAFYYRIPSQGKLNSSSYIRWGESWMLRAITSILLDDQKTS